MLRNVVFAQRDVGVVTHVQPQGVVAFPVTNERKSATSAAMVAGILTCFRALTKLAKLIVTTRTRS